MLYEGKAKKIFATARPDQVVQYFKDDATAFNAQKKGTIVDKGAVNNRVSERLFKLLEQEGIPTHFIERHAQEADAASASESRFKLADVGIRLLMFHDLRRTLPPPRDRMGRIDGAGLSWRVHLLPYLGEPELYEAFHFDEPWDSPHNRRLLEHLPDALRLGDASNSLTRFRVFAGPQSLFDTQDKEDTLRTARDGLAHTILVMIVPPELATPWTKPDEFELNQAAYETLLGKELLCYMANGQLLRLGADLEPGVLAALATPRGGEVVDADVLRRRFDKPPTSTERPASGDNAASPQAPAANPRVTQRERLNNVKRIVLALHNYHDTFRTFPVAARPEYFDENGWPKLSWRVHILPYLEQDALYQRFRLNEPWDSPHNKELLPLMPEVFRDLQGPADAVTTRLVVVRGATTPFPSGQPARFANFRDGTSQTILVVECGQDRAVPWTKPADIEFDPDTPLACLGRLDAGGFAFGYADGACHLMKPTVPAALFSALVTPAGGEVVNALDLDAHVIDP